MATVTVTDKTFQDEVLGAEVPVLVDFWAEWCGPCKMIGPALEELATEYEGRLKVAKVNVDENPNLPAQYGVRGIPALFMFKGGEVISNRTGAAPKAQPQGLDRRVGLTAPRHPAPATLPRARRHGPAKIAHNDYARFRDPERSAAQGT